MEAAMDITINPVEGANPLWLYAVGILVLGLVAYSVWGYVKKVVAKTPEEDIAPETNTKEEGL